MLLVRQLIDTYVWYIKISSLGLGINFMQWMPLKSYYKTISSSAEGQIFWHLTVLQSKNLS